MNEFQNTTLIALEKELLDSKTRADVKRLDELIHDDFIEFGSSGDYWNKKVVFERLPSENGNIKFTADNFKARNLSEDLVQVTFESVTHYLDKGTTKAALRSSLWKYENHRWQMIFHQGTIKAV